MNYLTSYGGSAKSRNPGMAGSCVVRDEKKIDQLLHRQELVEILKTRTPSYGSNPVNNLQIWAFYRGKTGVLIAATRLKRFLKQLR